MLIAAVQWYTKLLELAKAGTPATRMSMPVPPPFRDAPLFVPAVPELTIEAWPEFAVTGHTRAGAALEKPQDSWIFAPATAESTQQT